MADFRTERLLIRVAGAIDGFDPNEGVDVEEFAWLMIVDQQAVDRPSLAEFTFKPHDRPRWFAASKGLKVLRAVIAEYEAKAKKTDSEQAKRIAHKLEVLRAVEDRLDWIDTRDLKFYFQAKDLAD